jgi:hypothetical protein
MIELLLALACIGDMIVLYASNDVEAVVNPAAFSVRPRH